MNQDKQLEPLSLATELEQFAYILAQKSARELRRLHAESELHQQELASYRFTVENRDARIAELEAQLAAAQQGVQPLAWLAEYVDREGNSRWYVSTHKDLATENDMHGAPKPLYTHPTTQGLDAQIIQALSAGMSIKQWQSSVEVRIGSSNLTGQAFANGDETRIELVRRAVSEVFAAQAKQGDEA